MQNSLGIYDLFGDAGFIGLIHNKFKKGYLSIQIALEISQD